MLKDIDVIDFSISLSVRGVALYNFRALVCFILISIQTTWFLGKNNDTFRKKLTNEIFLVPLIPIIFAYIAIQTYYIATSRQLKRLESITRSPVYSHFQETVSGATSIRAYQVKDRFLEECWKRVDLNNRVYYPTICSVRWLTIRLEALGYTIVFLSSLFAIIFRDNLSPGLVGVR